MYFRYFKGKSVFDGFTARRILNAVIDFFVVMESSELETCIAIKKDVTEIVIEEVIDAANVNLAEINGHLNHPRMHEYEDIYDNPLESNTDNELDVIDDAIVKLDGDALSMKLTRLHQ